MSHSYYLECIVYPDRLDEVSTWAAKQIEERFPEADYVAAIGLSGTIPCSVISVKSGRFPFLCRKSEIRHSEYSEEFADLSEENLYAVIIDDLIATGDTIRTIESRLDANGITLIGILLYDECEKYNWDNRIPVICRGDFNEDTGEYKFEGRF